MCILHLNLPTGFHLSGSKETYVALPDTILPIWPLPRYALALPSEAVSMFISKTVKFRVRSSSNILQDAVKRYKLFVTSGGDHNKCTHKAVGLNTINVLVSDDNEDLNGDRKYEVIINSEIKDVTIIATSPFGAM